MSRVFRRRGAALAASFALVACGGGADPASRKSTVTGTFWGPIDAQVTLQNLAADDLTVSVPAFVGGPGAYNQQDFAFATLAPEGSAYEVTLKPPQPGLACAVYAGAMGTLPIAAGTVRVGCEVVNDLVSRSTDDSVKGTYYEEQRTGDRWRCGLGRRPFRGLRVVGRRPRRLDGRAPSDLLA